MGLHNVERNSFKELLEESTSSDLISHEPVLCESTTIAIQNKVPPSKEALDEVFRPSDDGVTSAAEQETVDNKRKKKAKTELLYSLSKSGKLWLQRSKQKRREYLASRGIWIEEEEEEGKKSNKISSSPSSSDNDTDVENGQEKDKEEDGEEEQEDDEEDGEEEEEDAH